MAGGTSVPHAPLSRRITARTIAVSIFKCFWVAFILSICHKRASPPMEGRFVTEHTLSRLLRSSQGKRVDCHLIKREATENRRSDGDGVRKAPSRYGRAPRIRALNASTKSRIEEDI